MAYKQIPNLPAVIYLNGSEELEAVQAGVDVRLTTNQVVDYALGRFAGSVIAGRSTVFIGDTPPVPAIVSTLWWSSALGQLFVYYDDGNSLQWVPASTVSGVQNPGNIDVTLFGAVGDGVANDTVAFASLEAAYPGAYVDLQGKTYLVNVVPTRAGYYNGGFKVGGTIYPAAWKKTYGPMDAQVTTVARVPGGNQPGGLWWDQSTNLLWKADYHGPIHDNSARSTLIVGFSRDHGATWEGWRTIFADETVTCVRSAAMGIMSNGRWGGLVTGNVDGVPTVRSTFFVFSDDGGVTWTQVDLTAGFGTQFPWGNLLPGPSGASGDWMAASYTGSATILRTIDNGTNWTKTDIKTSVGLPGTLVEPSVVKVPDGWFMTVRVLTTNATALVAGHAYVITTVGTTNWTLVGAASNTAGVIFTATGVGTGTGVAHARFCYASTSTDFVTWTPWVSTGVPLSSNLQWPLYDGGRIHLHTIVRNAAYTGTTPDMRFNSINDYSCEAHAAFLDPTLFGRTAPKPITGMTSLGLGGTILSTRLAQDANDLGAPWIHATTAGQGLGTTTEQTQSDVVIITQFPSNMPSVNMTTEVIPLVDNPIFSQWPSRIQASAVVDPPFGPITTDIGIAGRWRTILSGATMTVTKRVFTEIETSEMDFKPLFGCTVSTVGDPDNSAGLTQRFWGTDAFRIARLVQRSGDMVVRVYGKGQMPDQMRCYVIVNGGTWGTVAMPRPAVAATRFWMSEAVMPCGDLNVDWSTITSVQFGWDNGASLLEFNFTLCGYFMYPQECASNMPFTEPDNTVERVALYCRSLDAPSANNYFGNGVVTSTTSARIIVQHNPPFQTSLVSGAGFLKTPANWQVAAAANLAATFALPSNQTQLIAVATVAGATVGQPAMFTSTAADKIVFDTGY